MKVGGSGVGANGSWVSGGSDERKANLVNWQLPERIPHLLQPRKKKNLNPQLSSTYREKTNPHTPADVNSDITYAWICCLWIRVHKSCFIFQPTQTQWIFTSTKSLVLTQQVSVAHVTVSSLSLSAAGHVILKKGQQGTETVTHTRRKAAATASNLLYYHHVAPPCWTKLPVHVHTVGLSQKLGS